MVGVSEADATSFSHRNPLHSCGVDASVLLRLCEGHCSPRRRAAGSFRREIGNRGSRCVIHGRWRLFPLNLREMGKCNSHEACGLTSVALQSRENELSFLVLDDAKFRALVWSFGPSISFVHSGRVLRAELALCALVERNGAGVLTEGRRRWPARLKILGLRLRSGDREFDVRGADVEKPSDKPSSARNPKDKPVLLGVG